MTTVWLLIAWVAVMYLIGLPICYFGFGPTSRPTEEWEWVAMPPIVASGAILMACIIVGTFALPGTIAFIIASAIGASTTVAFCLAAVALIVTWSIAYGVHRYGGF